MQLAPPRHGGGAGGFYDPAPVLLALPRNGGGAGGVEDVSRPGLSEIVQQAVAAELSRLGAAGGVGGQPAYGHLAVGAVASQLQGVRNMLRGGNHVGEPRAAQGGAGGTRKARAHVQLSGAWMQGGGGVLQRGCKGSGSQRGGAPAYAPPPGGSPPVRWPPPPLKAIREPSSLRRARAGGPQAA
jgi:hypothetical protein